MKLKLIKKISKISLSLLIFSAFIKAKNLLAYDFNSQSGLDSAALKAGYTDTLKSMSPESILMQVISLVLTFVGVGFLILMIIGGFNWMTAQGNETKVDKAKKTITAGVIGLIVVFSAYAISYFIVNYFSGTTLSN